MTNEKFLIYGMSPVKAVFACLVGIVLGTVFSVGTMTIVEAMFN